MREAAPFLRALADAPCLVLLGAGPVWEADGRLDLFAEAKEADRYFHLEMPYIHGPNLRELGLAAGALATEEVAAVVSLVARKLAKLHAGGESHLDVKPENILVEAPGGGVFLTDFHMGTKAGSPGYAAPEQGEQPGPACDVYALSRLGLELWVGKLPARGALPLKLAPEPPPVADTAPEELRVLHRELAQLLGAGVDPSPAARPAMAELARLPGLDVRGLLARTVAPERVAELEALVARGVQGKRRAAAPGGRPPPSRGRWVLGGGLALGVLLVVGVVYAELRANDFLPAAVPDRGNAELGAFDPAAHYDAELTELSLGQRADPRHAYGTINAHFRLPAVDLWRSDRSTIWHQDRPRGVYRFDLRPGGYYFVQERRNRENPQEPKLDWRQFHVGAGETFGFETTSLPEMAPLPEPVDGGALDAGVPVPNSP
jgi:hypothetical protein